MPTPDDAVQTSSHRAWRRLVPLLGLLAVVAGGSWWLAQGVQARLQDTAQRRLDAAGIPATVEYDGRRAVVHADSADHARAAEAELAGLEGTATITRVLAAGAPSPTPSQEPSPSPTSSADPSPSDGNQGAGNQGDGNQGGRPPAQPRLLTRVRFPANGAILDSGDRARLDRVVEIMARHRRGILHVDGNTDNQGPDSWGWHMSQLRARAVADYLISHGVRRTQLVVQWHADRRPAASNDTDAGR